MSTHSSNSAHPARRQYFIKSDALSRIQQKAAATLPARNNSNASLEEFVQEKPIAPKHPRTNDLPGILALALKESSLEQGSPALMRSERSYFEVGRSMRRISLSQSGVRVERSLEASCMANDCPNRHIRVHYEELKNEYNEKIREIRRLTKLLEVGERKDTIHGHIARSESQHEAEAADLLRSEVEALKSKTARLESDLSYADVNMERLKQELQRKEELLANCGELTEEQLKYVEATTKPSNNTKRDSANGAKANKSRPADLDKANRVLKSQNAKLIKELEDLRNNYTEVCLKFEKSELNRSKASSSAETRSAEKMIKELQAEKRLMTEDIRALKEAHARVLREYETQLSATAEGGQSARAELSYAREDFGKLKTAYDKLLRAMAELETGNTTLKAQYKDAKHRSDTGDREREKLEEEAEVLRGRFVAAAKEKGELERKLYSLNDRLYELYALVRPEHVRSPRNDFGSQIDELISEAELEVIRQAINNCNQTMNQPSTDRKPDHNPFNSASNSVAEQRQPVDTDKRLASRFNTFVSAVKMSLDRLKGDASWVDAHAAEIAAEVSNCESRINDALQSRDATQRAYARLKEDSDKTGFMLNSLIEALNVDIKRKTKVWTSFSPGADSANYTLVTRLAQALELAQVDPDESDLRTSHRSEEVPSPIKGKGRQGGRLYSEQISEAQLVKKQKEATKISESSNPQQLLLLSHLMSNRESESARSLPNTDVAQLEALRTENELLKRHIIKLEAADASLSKTNDIVGLHGSPKGLMSEEDDNETLLALLESVKAECDTLRKENEALKERLNEVSMAMRANGPARGSSSVYDLINQTNFFPSKPDARTSEPTDQNATLSQDSDSDMKPQREDMQINESHVRPHGETEGGEFTYELAEIDDPQAVQEFVQTIVDAAREMDVENKELKAKMAQLEIELRKIQLETQGNGKLLEELEYYKVKLASLELAAKIGGQLKSQKAESRPESRRMRHSDELANSNLQAELTKLEALNNELSGKVFRLSEELERARAEVAQVRADAESRASVSNFLQSGSELLNSEVYALNVSDLNPNKAVAQMVQRQLGAEDAVRLQDTVAMLEAQCHNNQAELATLQNQLKSLERENGALKHKKAELEKAVELLNEENNAQTEQLLQLKTRLIEGRGSVRTDDSGETELRRMHSHTHALNDTLHKLNRANDQLLSENEALAKENKDLGDIRRKLYLQVTKLSAKSLHKDAELEKKSYRLSSALVQVAMLKSELERLGRARD